MSRIIERSSEIGVRKTFGASSARLVWQFIFENIFLCLTGGLVSLLAAMGVMRLIEYSGVIPYLDLNMNLRVFIYTIALAVLFGILSGAFPAWRMSRLHPVQALRGGGR
jgi:putative ABC transport system permease protein